MTNNDNERGSPGTSAVTRHQLLFITLLVLGTTFWFSPSVPLAAEVAELSQPRHSTRHLRPVRQQRSLFSPVGASGECRVSSSM